MDAVDPVTAQVHQSRYVCLLRQHLSLEAAHLAGGGCILRHGLTANDPAHGRIAAKPISIVHVLISSESPEHRLAKLGHQGVTAILTGSWIGENLSGQVCQAEGIIEVPKGEQTSVGRNSRTVKLQLQAGVESDPESGIVRFTRRPIHLQPR
jgi:hypothetical protein